MSEEAQVNTARTFWEESRDTTRQACDVWWLAAMSQIFAPTKNEGMPFTLAFPQFDKLSEFYLQQQKAAIDYMEKISAEYKKLITQ